MEPEPLKTFLEARDFLIQHRTDYPTAYQGFHWPQLTHFNWALDYFDVMAAGNDQPALWVVDESGAETKLSFAQMSERSNRVANFLRAIGVSAATASWSCSATRSPCGTSCWPPSRLGVVVIPATTLLTADDLRDRLERGSVRHVIAGAAHAGEIRRTGRAITRASASAARVAGWTDFEEAYQHAAAFTPDGPTPRRRPAAALLHLRHHHQAEAGAAHPPELPVGHLSTMYWIGLQPGDVHLNISSPGWAKHAWSCFFAPWNAGRLHLHLQLRPLQRPRPCSRRWSATG